MDHIQHRPRPHHERGRDPNGLTAASSFTSKGGYSFTSAVDISLTTTGLPCQDIDLSAYVPFGTKGAIVEAVHTGTTNGISRVVRGKPDTRN